MRNFRLRYARKDIIIDYKRGYTKKQLNLFDQVEPRIEENDMAKVLTVYYTWGGITKKLAEQIHAAAGGDILEIEAETPYTTDYKACVEQARKEVQEGYKPPLKTKIPDLSGYDVILAGCPNWISTFAPPMATFLSGANLAGKTVAPFCTFGGGGAGNIVKDVTAWCSGAKIADILAVKGETIKDAPFPEADLSAWLKKAGL